MAEERSAVAVTQIERKKKKRERKRKKRTDEPNFEMPGVYKLTLTNETQKFMNLIVGEHVTSEKPWKYVGKDMFIDHMDMHEETTEFGEHKPLIMDYPRAKILVGYVPDESSEQDEFYLCLTVKAEDAVAEIIEKQRKEQEAKLQYAVCKTARPWHGMGMEQEVNEAIPRKSRPLMEVEVNSFEMERFCFVGNARNFFAWT